MKGSGKGRTASESFAIIQHRQRLQTKVDQFQTQGLALMKTSPPKISARDAGNLDQLDFDEVDSEGVWLAADDEEIKKKNQKSLLKMYHSIFPQSSNSSKGRTWGGRSLEI